MPDRTGSIMSPDAERVARELLAGPYPLGQWVTIRGGVEDGFAGVVVGCRQHVSSDRPVWYVHDPDSGVTFGGLDTVNMDRQMADRCPYCGPGECHGSPRTANGADVDAFYRHHPRTRVPRVVTPAPYLLECYGCGALGSLVLFGVGMERRCPNCGSREVHNGEGVRS